MMPGRSPTLFASLAPAEKEPIACPYFMFASEDIASELSRSSSETDVVAGAARNCDSPAKSKPAKAKTVNASALKEADALLAEAEAGLFQAEAERSTARATLAKTIGRE